MKKVTFIGVSMLLMFWVGAQKVDFSQWGSMDVRNIGPAGMSGRITAIDVNPRNKDHIYVGSASGGVWESKNGGTTWNPIFDDTGVLSIGSIEINPMNPDEIWVGTGEGNPRNSHNSGAGIFFSNDAGKSWQYKGLKETKIIHRIIVDPSNAQIVYAGAMGSAWGPSDERGVYKSTDGGNTWQKSLYINSETGVADMVVDPSNPKKILVAMWEFGRKPWTFNSGGEGSGLYMTYDGGENWKEITSDNGLPKGILGRIGIAFATNKSNIIYALVEAETNGLYKSIDGGEKWSLVSEKNIGNRPFYYAELYVDPQNENRLYNVFTYLSKSEDGGNSFKNIADYGNSVHPDHHAFWIDPDNPNYIIDGNDGGLNISRDGGEHWQFVNNVPVGQFYHVNYDHDFPYHVYGGMQDNGTWRGPHTVYRRGGITNYDWQELFFGDGFDVVPDAKDSRYGYAMSQGGNVARYDRITGRTQMVKPVHPEGEKLRYNWNAAIAQDPFNECGLYFGSQFVHYSSDCGLSWNIISPDLTTNDTTKQRQDISGGLTIDATNAENYTTLLAIAPSPVDDKVVWAASDDGRLHITKDKGKNWEDVASRMPNLPRGAWFPQIEVSSTEAGTAFVVANDYRRNNWSAYAYVTKDYGVSWKRIIDDTKIPSFICSIIQDDEAEDLLFAGADNGLYVSIDEGNSWSKWADEMPPVQIRDMKIHPTEHDLILGTFGRALWIIDDIRPLRELAQDKSITNQAFVLMDSPDATLTYNRSYQGIRFSGQADFRADTKTRAAKINYYLKPEKEESTKTSNTVSAKSEKHKKRKKDKKFLSQQDEKQLDENTEKEYDDKIRFHVIDVMGDTLRSESRKSKEGFQSFYWYKDMKGVDWPSRKKRKKDEGKEPSGPDVLAGKYKMIVSYKEQKDSTMITVHPDPRIEYNIEKEQELVDRYKTFSKTIKESKLAMDKLHHAKEVIKAVSAITYGLPDSTAMHIDELNKKTKKSIKELVELYVMPEGLKGIQRDPTKLNSRLGTASWYLGSRWSDVGENTENLLNTTTKAAEETVQKVNEFLEGEWKEYQTEIEKLEWDLFKE